jgi:hypothetical protein
MHYYPPPFFGNYLPPWLWYDGDQHGGFDHLLWESYIAARMSEPASVTVTMWGFYDPGSGVGSISAQFRNDSTAAITGRVIFVLTEDSLYYPAPNGALWHSHVPRDYLPDQNGEVVNIASGDSMTVTRSFTIDPAWDDTQCRILTWIQNDDMQPDSTKEIWQGGMQEVIALGIHEYETGTSIKDRVHIMPNPCVSRTCFAFNLPQGTDYCISLFDVLGRHMKTLSGIAAGVDEAIVWYCDNEYGAPVGPGVYFYRFRSESLHASGKIVVR